MKVISKSLVVLLVLAGVAVPAAAQVCEPNSRVTKAGILTNSTSCTPLKLDGLPRQLDVGSLLFEEWLGYRQLEVRIGGITSSPTKSGGLDRKLTLVSVETSDYGSQSAVAATTQFELRSGENLKLRTLESSRNVTVVAILHRGAVITLR